MARHFRRDDCRIAQLAQLLGIAHLTAKAEKVDMEAKIHPSAVPASEFTRNFGHYRVEAQRGAVPVSSHGRIAGYFVAPHEYEEYERMKAQRRSFATAELSGEKVRAVAASRMDPRHKHLDALLKRK
jgi:hypothetical protein